jgi:hypothetical protein
MQKQQKVQEVQMHCHLNRALQVWTDTQYHWMIPMRKVGYDNAQ